MKNRMMTVPALAMMVAALDVSGLATAACQAEDATTTLEGTTNQDAATTASSTVGPEAFTTLTAWGNNYFGHLRQQPQHAG
jgi:hypothetical protein